MIKRYSIVGMSKPLARKLREKWERIIATEGYAMGLRNCSIVLENKLVNDIFYEGLFNGFPCIVKCSSRSPDSICNEYKMLVRVYTADSEVFPRPFGYWISRDGRFAFIIMEKVTKGVRVSCEKYAEGLKRIFYALRNTGVVHRDIIKDNIITDNNGMPKLIDFQFAIDRNSYSESNYMRKHMIYRLVLFGAGIDKKPGQWNDAVQLAWILRFNERNSKVDKIIEEIRSEFPTSNFECKMSWLEKIAVYGYDYILRICLLFAGGKRKKSLLARLSRI